MNKIFNANVTLTGVQDSTVKPSSSGKGKFQMLAQISAKLSLTTGEVVFEKLRGFFGKSFNQKGQPSLVVNFDARTQSKDGLQTYNNVKLSKEVSGLLRVAVLKAFADGEIQRSALLTESAEAAGISEKEVLSYAEKCMEAAAELAGDAATTTNTTSTKKLEDETATGGDTEIK